jgi:hypothetical protein
MGDALCSADIRIWLRIKSAQCKLKHDEELSVKGLNIKSEMAKMTGCIMAGAILALLFAQLLARIATA